MPSHLPAPPRFSTISNSLRHAWQRLAALARAARVRRAALGAAILAMAGVTASGFVPADDASLPAAREVELELAGAPGPDSIIGLDASAQQFVHEERVRRGDTLGLLLTRMAVNDPAAEAFVRSDAPARALYQLRPGRSLQTATDANGNLIWLRYVRQAGDAGTQLGDSASTLVLTRGSQGFTLSEDHQPIARHLEMRSAQIDTSLFGATDRAGIPDSIATQIADIFAGEIDFYRDLRRGDSLRVAYEMLDAGGEVSLPGRVLAVEFVNAGRSHQALWFNDGREGSGYYGPNGESLKRAFLRAPLAFTRISSGFGGRLHPILNIWRQHTGVDYAAPIGTPVRVTSDGVVDFVGVQTGYGNVVIVRHAGGLATVYGHLSAFAPGLRRGERVSQGDVIARVGMTGWATGPHLHYEFRINGVPRDPLKVVLPPATPIAPERLSAFREQTAPAGRILGMLRDIDRDRSEVTQARAA